MRNYILITLSIITLTVLITPIQTLAQTKGLVNCNPHLQTFYEDQNVNGVITKVPVQKLVEGCTICDFLQFVKNIIDFVIKISFALAGLFITWGAFVTMTAGGAEERVKKGREILTTAVVGLIIMLSAWLILGTVIQVLTGSPSKLPWTEIRCTF